MTTDHFKAAIDALAATAAQGRWDTTVTLTQARAAANERVISDWYTVEAGLAPRAALVLCAVIETLTDAEVSNVILSLAGDDRSVAGALLARALKNTVARDVQEHAQTQADLHEISATFNEGHRPIVVLMGS